MKRPLIAGLACALLLALGLPALSGGAPGRAPRALLRSFVCQTARDPAGRGISVTAVMRPRPHTRAMALRFQLLERQHLGGPATRLAYGDLGRWLSPANPTLGQRPGDRFVINKQVLQLAAPAYYRFRVTFRWTGAHGKVLGTAVRYSPACFQPELRPDLQVAAIHVKQMPASSGKDMYEAMIRNRGDSAVGPFDVRFAVTTTDGTLSKDKTVPGLPAHGRATVTFVGPACQAGSPPTITADPGLQTDDYNRANNALTAVCPTA